MCSSLCKKILAAGQNCSYCPAAAAAAGPQMLLPLLVSAKHWQMEHKVQMSALTRLLGMQRVLDALRYGLRLCCFENFLLVEDVDSEAPIMPHRKGSTWSIAAAVAAPCAACQR